jgi:hypothetical protein
MTTKERYGKGLKQEKKKFFQSQFNKRIKFILASSTVEPEIHAIIGRIIE